MLELARPIELLSPPIIRFGTGAIAELADWMRARGCRRPFVVAEGASLTVNATVNEGGTIRAEQLRLAGLGEAITGCDTLCEGTVSDVIFEGERVVYEVSPEKAPNLTLRLIDADPRPGSLPQPGATMTLGFSAADMFVYPT